MKTHIWEDLRLFNINKELQDLIDAKVVKTVVSMSLVAVESPTSSISLYSAILIYK
jgi:hypothetical protein